jgi:hypothetical protein
MDWHGNSEWITMTNCTIDGGITPGGNNWKLDGNLIRGSASNGDTLCYVSELQGTNISITNNTFYSSAASIDRGAFIDIGGNSIVISSDTREGGTIMVSGNSFYWDFTPLTDNGGQWICITQRGYAGNKGNISVDINNNTLLTKNNHHDYGLTYAQYGGGCTVRYYSGDRIRLVKYNNNSAIGAAGLQAYSSGGVYGFDNIMIDSNYVAWSNSIAMQGRHAKHSVTYTNNRVEDCPFYTCYLSGYDSANRVESLTCTGNSHTHGGWKATSSSATNSSFLLYYADNLLFQNNFTGHDTTALTVSSNSSFTVGETITGSSSGATAKVTSKTSSTGIIIHDTATGTFTISDTITGSTSGATATVSNVYNTYYYRARIQDITNCWRDNNIDYNGKPFSISNITNDYTTI